MEKNLEKKHRSEGKRLEEAEKRVTELEQALTAAQEAQRAAEAVVERLSRDVEALQGSLESADEAKRQAEREMLERRCQHEDLERQLRVSEAKEAAAVQLHTAAVEAAAAAEVSAPPAGLSWLVTMACALVSSVRTSRSRRFSGLPHR